MFRPRLIPVLLLRNNGLVKPVQFKKGQYIGDPLNAVRILNKFKTDELVFLDIDATRENRLISLEFVKQLGDEAFMPFAVGGGIKSLEDVEKLISAGAEKVVLNTAVWKNPQLIMEIANVYGSQSVIVAVDVKKNWLGVRSVYVNSGTVNTKMSPVAYAKRAVEYGAGEIMITNVQYEGMNQGLDLELIKEVSSSIPVPVIGHGGVYSLSDFKNGIDAGASAVAGGSFFVYSGKQKGILVNYPSREQLNELFKD